MKETIGNSLYQERVSCLIEFVLPFLVGVSELQIRLGDNLKSYILFVLKVGEVEAVLNSVDPNKAAGPDEIPARILKETATTIAPSLFKLFNRSLEEGYIPSEWKLANVMPAYKKDEKDHVENYRPISLLCIISKVLERCVLNRINDRLEDLIANCQHGFRSGRSCVTNLLETLDYIGAILDRAGQVDCVYLDMSKAFVKVRHDLLMEKLRDAGFGVNLLTWFRTRCDIA